MRKIEFVPQKRTSQPRPHQAEMVKFPLACFQTRASAVSLQNGHSFTKYSSPGGCGPRSVF